MSQTSKGDRVSSLRARLLSWYDANARALPWRATRDPYAIWVSEIMLQQTRVDTVIPYYERFMRRFPSVGALADAPLDDVLAAWSGLGYYRRARMLHQGAQAVARTHAGSVPRDAKARLALPGVGRYTAGAIGSIAFDLPEPIVDGNVARVLSRVHAMEGVLGERTTERALWEAAAAMADGPRPGALNQALMELGALICTPQKPRCDRCPVRAQCKAYALGRVDELPVSPKKKAPLAESLVALVPRTPRGKLWLTRSEGSRFGGLWGLPLQLGTTRSDALALAKQHALHGELSPEEVARVRHVLTHRALEVHVFALACQPRRPSATLRCVDPSELAELGIARLTYKILAASKS